MRAYKFYYYLFSVSFGPIGAVLLMSGVVINNILDALL